MANNWERLQNGSDIRGVAIEGVTGESINLTPSIIETLGKAFVKWLKQKGFNEVSIAVGVDSRISGPKLKAAFSLGIISQGAHVFDCDMASTPAMFMSTISDSINVQGGVMLTASHLPFNRNGLKFFTSEGGLNKVDITEILNLASGNQFIDADKAGEILSYDLIGEYAKHLVNTIQKQTNDKEPLKGAKIIVDAGNGAGGFFAYKVLQPLGADTAGSQFLNPDGRFLNHVPNPEDPDAMASICKAVLANKADLGIIFDTDVDRSAIVDRNGNPINRNALIALIASIVLEEHPGSIIVTDSITSDELASFIENNLNGKHHRFKRGYKNVINESIRLNNAGKESWLAIETSGHAALKENYFLDDGAFLVAKLLVKMAQLRSKGKNLDDLIEDLKHPLESKEFRLKINSDDFIAYGNKAIAKVQDKVDAISGWEKENINYEGIRVKCNNANEQAWFLLRLSLHDPVIPLNIESKIEGGIEMVRQKLRTIMQEFDCLDLSGLE